MKKLTLLAVLLGFGLLQSCITGNDTEKQPTTDEPTTAVEKENHPHQDEPVTMEYVTDDSEAMPSTIITIKGRGVKHTIEQQGVCNPIAKDGFSKKSIPADTKAACSCWWAGAGADYYATTTRNTVQIYKRVVFEEDTELEDWKMVNELAIK